MSRTLLFPALAALVGGVAVSVQAVVLANLGRSVDSARAGLLTYASGGAVATLILIATRGARVTRASPVSGDWVAAVTAGVLGVGILVAIAYSTSRVSVAAGLAMFLVGQSATSVLLDAIAIAGPVVPLDLRRVAGLLALATGTYLLLPR